jgi:hypothetical protein
VTSTLVAPVVHVRGEVFRPLTSAVIFTNAPGSRATVKASVFVVTPLAVTDTCVDPNAAVAGTCTFNVVAVHDEGTTFRPAMVTVLFAQLASKPPPLTATVPLRGATEGDTELMVGRLTATATLAA